MLLVVTDYIDKFQPHLTNYKNEIAADLIEMREAWKSEDFVNFFKFARQYKTDETKQYGKMTFDSLMELVAVYEDKRAEALEDFHRKQKGQYNGQGERVNSDTSLKSLMAKESESVRVKNQNKKIEVGDVSETFFRKS